MLGLNRHGCDARFGRVLLGIRENETRMEAIGFPIFRYSLIGFVIAGALAGLAGALLANQNRFVSPAALHWTQSGTLMVMVILGGVGFRYGGAARRRGPAAAGGDPRRPHRSTGSCRWAGPAGDRALRAARARRRCSCERRPWHDACCRCAA